MPGFLTAKNDLIDNSPFVKDLHYDPAENEAILFSNQQTNPDERNIQLKEPKHCFSVKVAIDSNVSEISSRDNDSTYRRCPRDFQTAKATFESMIRHRKLNTECLVTSAARVYRKQKQIVVPFIWGILVGITITAVLFQQHILFSGEIHWPVEGGRLLDIEDKIRNSVYLNNSLSHEQNRTTVSSRFIHHHLEHNLQSPDAPALSQAEETFRTKTRIFVGVISAEKFLNSRAVAVNNTWGNQVDKLEFFAEHGTPEQFGVPVVNLDGISDHEYPPQKKAFRMLQHMCTHHINKFEWFVRADDDVYIRVELLKKFLTQIDSDKMIYMGQPGHGVPEVRDRLGLHGHNFCMGGPGVIFNRKALRALCPHINQCIDDVVSGEEDVEIGRCVTTHLHIECTHAWETLKLFYHSYQEEYTEEKPFLGNLAENEHVSKALTLHHIKVPYIMYRVHRHYTSMMLNDTVQHMKALRNDLDYSNFRLPMDEQRLLATRKQIPATYKPNHLNEVSAWKAFGTDSIYSLASGEVTSDITNDILADLKQIGETGIDEAIGFPQQQFTYSHVSDGYVRSDPVRGTDYLLDVYFNSRTDGVSDEIRRVHLVRPLDEVEVTHTRRQSATDKDGATSFHIILPISKSRGSDLDVFMRNQFEPGFLSSTSVRANLVVVPLDDASKPQSPTIHEVVSWYRVKYPSSAIDVIEPPVVPTAEAAYFHALHNIQQQQEPSSQSPLVLFTSTNLTVTSHVFYSCLFRTGVSDVTQSDSIYSNYNFVDYKSRKKRSNKPFSQIYQPVPFRVFPAASGLQAVGDTSRKISSEIGFWDDSAAFGEEGNSIIAPLCGRLDDLRPPALSAGDETADVNTTALTSFKKSIYDRIYSGQLTIMRSPDRDFFSIPRR